MLAFMVSLPRHPLTRAFTSNGLFAGVATFRELEERISGLLNEHERGAAFEVFAEAWLTTQRIPQARIVWPGKAPPPSLLEKLRLPFKDMGVDGIFETLADEPVCYQAKFRRGRPALTWGELGTFFGLADSGNSRLVFTNCDDIASVAEQRPGAVFVRGSDLDRLAADDFRVIEAWLAGAVVPAKRKSPLPHQQSAIDDILRGLARHDRATARMACGTGKTLVAMWVAERLETRTVLILLPSLALVRQTLHEWLHETNWADLAYLCVCSDPTVASEEDALIVRPCDVDFKVTTQSADVRRFLERATDSVRLVFSTYQSSSIVAQGVAGLPAFDLGIFDEAHKTAGRDGARFAFALTNERLAISRRLFLTATPRHYHLSTRDKFAPSKIVFSMDAPDVYGPVVHRLPFGTAARLGVITDYKVLISIVTSSMVTDEAIRRGIVLVEGEPIKARQVANQIALQSVIERYEVRKIFTFHSRVASARSFTSAGAEGIATHLPTFHCDHINGEMPTALRERRMREFEAAPRAIMSNARCLTEGVDVPTVDMVAFLSPRRSLVDIVQATGRAMRLSPKTGKKVGYVLVPLYVEQARGETVEEAVVRSDFADVWRVLHQLQEHDDLLAQTIAEMRTERGKTGGFDDSRFREKVEFLPPELSYEALRLAITAACLDAIGDSWFERYGQLVAYRERHGTCEMPHRLAKDKSLATWVINQRVLWKEGLLSRERIALLDKIGFKWSPKAHTWRENYLALLAYKEKHGNCRVPQEWAEDKRLAKWVSTQRVRWKRGQLNQERIAMLERVGFEWVTGLGTWDQRFAELVEFGKANGHLRVPARWPENRKLATWVVSQRSHRREGKLRAEWEKRLTSIGFEWDLLTPDATWNRWFQRLHDFKSKNGHCNVTRADREDGRLAAWVTSQRRARREGKLSAEAENRLDQLGFSWLPKPGYVSWDDMFARLCTFREAKGHVNVPPSWPDKKLARWVGTQRGLHREGALLPERLRKLESVGFKWRQSRAELKANPAADASEKIWDGFFKQLADYFKNFGDCNVPHEWHVNRPLARWVARQRNLHRADRLTAGQERRLAELGFTWGIHTESWEAMFAKLAAQMEIERGGIKPHFAPKLLRWMNTQRQLKKQCRLAPEREAKLGEIGFAWQPHASVAHGRWDALFRTLSAFKEKHGHCLVPQRWKEDRSLAGWVSEQRMARNRGALDPALEQRLTALGFNWDPVGGNWESMFAQLVEFHREHGHCNAPQKSRRYGKLATWVHNQRCARKVRRRSITPERAKRLEALGFKWTLIDPLSWEAMFAKLVEFKSLHGHCKVPQKSGDKRFGKWVNTQRTQAKRGKLQTDRRRQLDEIGFVWNAKPSVRGTVWPK